MANFGRQHDVLAPWAEDLAELLLRAAAIAVDVGGVEQRNAGLDRAVDDLARGVDPHRAEIVAAEADDRDFDSRFAEFALFHGRSSGMSGRTLAQV